MTNRYNMPAFMGPGYGTNQPGAGAQPAPPRPIASAKGVTIARPPRAMRPSPASTTSPGAGSPIVRPVSTKPSDRPMRQLAAGQTVRAGLGRVPKVGQIPKVNPKGMGQRKGGNIAKPKTGMK